MMPALLNHKVLWVTQMIVVLVGLLPLRRPARGHAILLSLPPNRQDSKPPKIHLFRPIYVFTMSAKNL